MTDTLKRLVEALYRTFFAQMQKFLKRCGYPLGKEQLAKFSGSIDDQALHIAELFYDKRSHRLQPRVRRVLKSSILETKISNHDTYSISTKDIEGISRIEIASTQGRDLFQFYSKKVLKLATNHDKQDKLFNDWNILHFHLGAQSKEPLVERTRNVLFAFPLGTELLFIDVRPHDINDAEPWYDKELIEIMHRNWPDFIESFKSKGTNVRPRLTESIVKVFRGETEQQMLAAKQTQSSYTMSVMYLIGMSDGTVYHPFGEGLASNGIRHMDVRRSLSLLKDIVGWAKNYIADHVSEIASEPEPVVKIVGTNLWDCRLQILDEKNNKVLAERSL